MRVAINGFGRIGRAFFRLAKIKTPDKIDIVAINDLATKDELEYLLQNDSVYGWFNSSLQNLSIFSEKDPENLPWEDLQIDIVVESTGIFRTRDLAAKHIKAGAKHVVVSAPSPDIKTILIGINDENIKEYNITSNASCTTNAIAPVYKTLDEVFSIKSSMLTTVHSYTSTQSLVDSANKKDLKRGRAAALNIIPTTTGAADALARVYEVSDFSAMAVRVPTPAGSLIDFTALFDKPHTTEDINDAIKESVQNNRWRNIFTFSDKGLVSTDIVGRPKSSIVDLTLTQTAGEMAKIFIWYDNEVGYTASLLEHVLLVGESKKLL